MYAIRRFISARSESSLSTLRNFASFAIQNASREDSDQTVRVHRLFRILTGCKTVLHLDWAHMSEGTFSDVAAQKSFLFFFFFFLHLLYYFVRKLFFLSLNIVLTSQL